MENPDFPLFFHLQVTVGTDIIVFKHKTEVNMKGYNALVHILRNKKYTGTNSWLFVKKVQIQNLRLTWPYLAHSSSMSRCSSSSTSSGPTIFLFKNCGIIVMQLKFNMETRKKQCWGSVTCWCGSGLVPLTKGSNSFLQWLQGCKKTLFIIFSYNLPAVTLSSVLKILFSAKIC